MSHQGRARNTRVALASAARNVFGAPWGPIFCCAHSAGAQQARCARVLMATVMATLCCGWFAICAAAGEPWQRHAVDDSSRGADGVRLADFNDDGRLDIATGWEEGGVIRLYLQPDAEKIREAWPRVTVGNVTSAEDAVPVDLDGDGALDIVSACEGKTRTLYVHWGPKDKSKLLDESAWQTEAFPQGAGKLLWMFTLPLQVDGQRGVDLVAGTKGAGGGVGCFYSPKNPRDLASWEFEVVHEMSWLMSLQAHDMNGDNALDVLLSNRKGSARGIYWLVNPKAKGKLSDWKLQRVDSADLEYMFLARGELSGDERPDVISAVRGAGLQLLTAPRDVENGKWGQSEISLPTGIGTGKGVAVGDIDLDGTNDIVFSCENATGGKSGVRWLARSVNNNAWTDHEISGPAGVKFDRIELLDFDRDGDLDVLTCEEREKLGVIWYENPTR